MIPPPILSIAEIQVAMHDSAPELPPWAEHAHPVGQPVMVRGSMQILPPPPSAMAVETRIELAIQNRFNGATAQVEVFGPRDERRYTAANVVVVLDGYRVFSADAFGTTRDEALKTLAVLLGVAG